MIKNYKGISPQIHETAYTAKSSSIIGKVKIGKDCSIWDNAVLRGDEDDIVVGEGSNIQDCCTVHCTSGYKTVIGKYVTVGHNAVLHSCEIGDGTLVGMGAIILDGAKVGSNCLIGAGSLITPNTIIPDNSLVLGSPAKVKKEISSEQLKEMQENNKRYIELKNEHMETQK